LTGGGTGGHVYPALAVAEALRQIAPEAQLLYIGGDRMEARTVPEAGLPFRQISVHGLAGRSMSLGRRFRSIIELGMGLPLFQSLRILRGFGPDVVLGTGGYVSGPVLLAARILGLPCAALDGNRVPGHTSRIVARLVDLVAVAHGELAEYFSARVRRGARVEVTGLPVRPEITAVSRESGAAALGLDPSRPTVLALGGSLGSERINRAVTGAVELLATTDSLRQLQVLHVTGERFAAPASESELPVGRYRRVPYLGADYPQALAAADLVVSRAGASTLAEITARGLPAILIPWARAATGEQVQNAQALAGAGGAVMIRDHDLSPERLAAALESSLGRRAELDRMAAASRSLGHPGAAPRVAELVLELASRRKRAGRGGGLAQRP
jgi:UDP-N-acetylglucosamine--N-acetylmuramyl-(pentapeptide) pyrophosphoryl-undecaprenol N-acetylglucosamine transferase